MICPTKCALCNDPINVGDSPEVYEVAAQRHHAVCMKRPIEVGDFVEARVHPGCNITGKAIALVSGCLHAFVVAVEAGTDGIGGSLVGKELAFGSAALRRIPRPAAHGETEATRIRMREQVVSERYIEPPAVAPPRQVFPRGADRTKPCGMCGGTFGGHYGVACDRPRMEGYETGPVCTPDCRCGAHAPTAAATESLYDCMRCGRPESVVRDSCVGCHASNWSPRYQDNYRAAFARWNLALDVAPPPAPAPALVDGIDREVCLSRWMENRLAVEGGAAPPNAMTRMQRDVGRTLWLERFGAARAAELRARVAAGREAERNRVRVDLEVDPWD